MKITIHYLAFYSNEASFEFPAELVKGLNIKDALEVIYRQCNHVDGTEWIADKPFRSFSCGDEIQIGNRRFRCLPAGWDEVFG